MLIFQLNNETPRKFEIHMLTPRWNYAMNFENVKHSANNSGVKDKKDSDDKIQCIRRQEEPLTFMTRRMTSRPWKRNISLF